MQKIFLTFLILCASFLSLQAQDKDLIDKYADLRNEKDSLQKVVSSQMQLIQELRDSINRKNSQLDSLLLGVAAANNSAGTLSDSIANLKAQLDHLGKDKVSFDTVRMRVGNWLLQYPYNPKTVPQALNVIQQVEDPTLKEKFIDLPTCLNDFPEASKSVAKTLQELQKSTDNFSKFKLEDWKKEANNIIKSDSYFIKSKSYRGGVSIYFLDKILKEAQERVNKATDPKQVSFKDLFFKNSL